MMKFWIFWTCVFFLLNLNAKAQHKTTADAQIPVLAWYGIIPEETTLSRYKEMREAGITHNFTGFHNADAMQKALDIALKAGVKIIVSCPELEDEPEKTVKRFMKHPAVAGYFLRDEPSKADFKHLGEWARRIRAVDDKNFCYLNLLPNYASAEQLGYNTYREYVKGFDQEVPLQLLSFDHYPVIGESGNSIRENWYENLEIFAAEAVLAKKPFWAFALAVAHDPYPIPTMAALRLQVYSNLAYGAQGIQYFTYWTPVSDTWNFHHGPITADGKRTEVYDKIKDMSKEIKDLSHVFLGAKVQGVWHTGENIPTGTTRLTQLPDVVHELETTGTGAVVSLIENNKKKFLVIVNRDLTQKMKLRIKTNEQVNKILKNGAAVNASIYADEIFIEPGDVTIYQLN
jgi:DNA-binding Lrp family transcriptional regulator